MRSNRTARSVAYLLALVGVLVVVTALNAWLTTPTHDGGPRAGAARVIDGDTFGLCNAADCKRVRLCGINAPERDEPGYQAARLALIEMVAGRTVTCVPVGNGTICDDRSDRTTHGRIVAQCGTPAISDLAGELVRRGHACDLTGFTRGYYRDRFGGRAC